MNVWIVWGGFAGKKAHFHEIWKTQQGAEEGVKEALGIYGFTQTARSEDLLHIYLEYQDEQKRALRYVITLEEVRE